MSTKHIVTTDASGASRGSVASYSLGFALSIICTLAAYQLVVHGIFHGWGLVFAIVSLAVVQLLVQLLFFLHLGQESKPRWNLTVFAFMLIIVGILVIGSLWIMANLNYHGMTAHQSENFLLHDEGVKP